MGNCVVLEWKEFRLYTCVCKVSNYEVTLAVGGGGEGAFQVKIIP